jgi:glutamate/tyrosine decarboxylase-like PLP-dependent enzyme
MIVGTVGAMGSGFVDPLDEIADVAADNNAWFHADAAWGGAAVLVPRLRPVVRAIERADSITWDAHKWLSAPMGAGMFFCRHPEPLPAFSPFASSRCREAGEGVFGDAVHAPDEAFSTVSRSAGPESDGRAA